MSLRYCHPLAYVDREIRLAPMSPRIEAFRIETLRGEAMRRRDAAVKRGADILLALAALTLLAVPMLLVAALIRLTSQGPAVFSQKRIGLNGRPFRMLKFRTMRHQAEPPPCRQATRRDPRVTRFGALLRRTSFDELPQLLNVLAGSMSMVGPRPHAPGTCVAG